jgi:folate-dependent phosphoribosylglycinamide formyltransferase PurN
MQNKKVIILATDGNSTNAIFHAVRSIISIETIILEEPVPKLKLVKGRVKRLGAITVFGQLLFQILVQPFLTKLSRKRINEIANLNQLDFSPIAIDKIRRVTSVNDEETIRVLKESQPSLIIINGTRIISKRLLNAVPCKWINIHAGITPKYRGVHGGYWALKNKEENLSGVTLHFVDHGIDTGKVIGQKIIKPSNRDNFATYPYLQLAEGIKLLLANLEVILMDKEIMFSPLTSQSALWYHPTIWSYFYNYLFYNLK